MVNSLHALYAIVVTSTLVFIGVAGAGAQDVRWFDDLEHVHDLAADPGADGGLILATHAGLFAARPDGSVTRIGTARHDFMAFTEQPAQAGVYYASGHPQGGGNLGVLASKNGGNDWRTLSAGAGGPVDFHDIAATAADGNRLYGLFDGLQVSRDGGRTWQAKDISGLGHIYDIAVSSTDADRLFAATRNGLMVSTDAGTTWTLAHFIKRPATAVQVSPDGVVYAFIVGTGLVRTEDSVLRWQKVSSAFDDRVPLRLAFDARDDRRLHTIVDTGNIMTSGDGGRTWTAYVGHRRQSPETIARGKALYTENCASCHGEDGIGENPRNIYARDEYGFVAPPLNDDAHAWHHSDENLVQVILEGSARNSRMIAWKQALSRDDAEDLVAYVKSLWRFRSLACQGKRHMSCM